MTKTILTTALKPHLDPTLGRIVQVGEPIEVEEQRFKALAKKGYVPPAEGDEEPAEAARTPGVITNADVEPKREPIVAPLKAAAPKTEKASSAARGHGRRTADAKGA